MSCLLCLFMSSFVSSGPGLVLSCHVISCHIYHISCHVMLYHVVSSCDVLFVSSCLSFLMSHLFLSSLDCLSCLACRLILSCLPFLVPSYFVSSVPSCLVSSFSFILSLVPSCLVLLCCLGVKLQTDFCFLFFFITDTSKIASCTKGLSFTF